jgi:diguanylate cyclase (GGDEF)-like protein
MAAPVAPGLRGKIALVSAAVMLAVMMAISTAGAWFFSVEYGAALESRSLAIAKSLKVQLDRLLQFGLDVDSLVGFEEQCEEIVRTYSGVEEAMVIGRDGTILFHSDRSRIGRRIDDASLASAIGGRTETVVRGTTTMAEKVSAVVPVVSRGEAAAVVVVAFPERLIGDQMRRTWWRQVGVGMAFLAVGLVALLLMLSAFVTRPVTRLIRAVERMEGRALTDAQPAPVESADELGRLASTFNRLLSGLKQTTVSKHELEARNGEISLLSEMNHVLLSALTVEEAYRLVPSFGRRLFAHADGTLFVFSPGRDALHTGAAWGEAAAAPELAATDCWALRRGQAHFVRDPASDVVCPHAEAAARAGRPHACVPLSAHGEIIGLLHLAWPAGHALADTEQALAAMLAEQLSFALGNLRLREALREQSVRDGLTGLFNRRYLEATLDRELARAARAGTPLAVVMADIDHFKRINDTLGHDAGDDVLRAIARKLLGSVRASDIVCRYGGEEFVVLMPDASAEAAVARAERLRASLAELDPPQGAGKVLPRVTVSAGVAAYPDHAGSGAALIALADEALYAAKRNGRDQVRMFTSAQDSPATDGTERPVPWTSTEKTPA